MKEIIDLQIMFFLFYSIFSQSYDRTWFFISIAIYLLRQNTSRLRKHYQQHSQYHILERDYTYLLQYLK